MLGDAVQSAGDFLRFMTSREELRLKKESGGPWPWSDDPILNLYKFTNVKREHDRTTRWMRSYWTKPNEDRPAGEIIFNCALFRYFGTSEFAEATGWQRDFDPYRVACIAANRKEQGLRVFTGAYIIPTLGLCQPKHEIVSHLILKPIWDARSELATAASKTRSWRAVAERLRLFPGFGGTGFMTKEVLQDVMQTPVLWDAIDKNTWCPAGPGARRGLNRIYGRPVTQHISESTSLREMLALFKFANQRLAPFMPKLELHDIQFQLCEFDKYERARLGEGRPKARYKLYDSKFP